LPRTTGCVYLSAKTGSNTIPEQVHIQTVYIILYTEPVAG